MSVLMDLSEKKSLWIWETGQNDATESAEGQYGKSGSGRAIALKRTPALQLEDLKIRQFAIGKSCAVVVSNEEKLYQIGSPGVETLTLDGIETTLREVSVLKTHVVTQVACGYHHIATLIETGSAFCWGLSSFGQCGVVADLVSKPNLVKFSTSNCVQLEAVSCGKLHTMAISHERELWGWGISGMVGGPTTTHRNTPMPHPQLVESLHGRKVLQVSCGKHHTIALTEKLPKTGPSTTKPETTEICEVCHREIYKWEDSELIMQDNGDQVIIMDTHTCPHKTMQSSAVESKRTVTPLIKSPTHARSMSLPFFKRKESPSMSRNDKSQLSKTPTPQEIPLHLFSSNKFPSDTNIPRLSELPQSTQKGIGLAQIPVSSKSAAFFPETREREDDIFASEPVHDVQRSVTLNQNSTEGGEFIKDTDVVDQNDGARPINIPEAVSSGAGGRQCRVPKSTSVPIDLWKQGRLEKSVFLFSDAADSHDPVFPCTPGSSSASLVSLDDCKSRMTLPVQPDERINLDADSALSYLKQLSPVVSESEIDHINGADISQSDLFENNEIPLSEKPPNQDRESRQSISERITKSFTENQLISPLTSYSKNVFTGVMDHIEWIKTSTYDKGVAPIRELLTRDRSMKKEKEESMAELAVDARSEDSFQFTSDHTLGTPKSDPLLDNTPLQENDHTLSKMNEITLHTEVWSWGENKHGALGLSDDLDRLQPASMKMLSHRGIVKVVCGAHHTVALTSNSEVYTWGSNSHGQLGHEKSHCHSPEKVQCKTRIWDIAAGRCHTLVLADGVGQKPSLLICGTGQIDMTSSNHPLLPQTPKKNVKDWRLRPIDFSHKMGFQSTVISGFSTLSSCLTEDNCSSFTLALYDFAKAEREFYQHVTLVKTDVLRPLKFSDLYKLLEHTPYCDMLSQATELFGTLCYNIGLNTVRLTRAVVSSEERCKEVFAYAGNTLIESYSRYFESLNNVIAYGFFEKCEAHSVKRAKFLSEPKIVAIFKKLLGDKRFSKLPSENFLQILQYPAFRIREYTNTLSRLALSVENNTLLSKHVEALSFQWNAVWTKLNNRLHSANQTRGFWKNEFKSTSGAKLAESLKEIGRHLIIHSKKVPIDVAHSGRFSYNWFILFTDCLAVVHYGTYFLHPLELLWCVPFTDSKDKSRTIKLTMPEDEIIAIAATEESKSAWLNALYRAINVIVTEKNGRRESSPLQSDRGTLLHRSPPQSRNGTHTFTKDPHLKGAKYTGAWLNGKPHGRGEMTWDDGRKYTGNYKNGAEDGFGEWKASPSDPTRLKYRGWWTEGKMDGYGKIWYSRYQSYEGFFVAGQREGHGVLRTGSVTEGSVYVGGWHKDQRSGYGIEDNITKGEKYLGMWTNDQRNGVGILVTLDGLYCQTRFHNGEVGGDALLIEGRYAFEGQVSAGMVLCGKGRLTMPTGDKLEGSFTGPWGENVRVSGNLIRSEVSRSSSIPESPKTPLDLTVTLNHHSLKDHNVHSILKRYNRHIMRKLAESKGSRSFPLSLHPDGKWKEVFAHCRSSIACPQEDSTEPIDLTRIWAAVPVAISNARQKREFFKPAKSSPIKIDEAQLNWLERVPSVVNLAEVGSEAGSEMRLKQSDVCCIQEYLTQSFSTTLHPLGELAESLGNVFRDSYSGAGAHKWLLTHAVADIRSFVRRSYDIVSCMFPQLTKEPEETIPKPVIQHAPDGKNSRLRSYSDDMPTNITAGDLMLPVLLPRLYPTLFTLYALRHENEDRSYWERVARLNRHPDVALLSFLGVKPKFWLLDEKEIPPFETSPDDGQLYENEERAESSKWRHLLVARARDCTFLSAVETLQLISTTFIPAEKLNVIHSTFKEINSNATKYLHANHAWSMDDLFPVFQYVVIRARISHLGCEIQLIEDFLEPDLCKGEKGIMFTTLKACYFQIRVEKDL